MNSEGTIDQKLADRYISNWKRFIDVTTSKSNDHSRAAKYNSRLNDCINLLMIFFGVTTATLSLIEDVPEFVTSIVAGISTLISALYTFLKPEKESRKHLETSRTFQNLMYQMARCEQDIEYNKIWDDLNVAILDEPLLSKKFAKNQKRLENKQSAWRDKSSTCQWSPSVEFEKVLKKTEYQLIEEMLNIIDNGRPDETEQSSAMKTETDSNNNTGNSTNRTELESVATPIKTKATVAVDSSKFSSHLVDAEAQSKNTLPTNQDIKTFLSKTIEYVKRGNVSSDESTTEDQEVKTKATVAVDSSKFSSPLVDVEAQSQRSVPINQDIKTFLSKTIENVKRGKISSNGSTSEDQTSNLLRFGSSSEEIEAQTQGKVPLTRDIELKEIQRSNISNHESTLDGSEDLNQKKQPNLLDDKLTEENKTKEEIQEEFEKTDYSENDTLL